MSQHLNEKRRIVEAVRAVRARSADGMRRLREEAQRRMEPIRQQCAESGGHVFGAETLISASRCVFCDASEVGHG
jgi:hypothetical protein